MESTAILKRTVIERLMMTKECCSSSGKENEVVTPLNFFSIYLPDVDPGCQLQLAPSLRNGDESFKLPTTLTFEPVQLRSCQARCT